MSIHAVDLVCAADTDNVFVAPNGFVDVWLTNHVAWEPDGDLTQDNARPTLDTEPGVPDHYRGGIWRFEWTEDRSILLDNLEGHASSYCPWYRIRWHECDHDGAWDECSWDESATRTGGTVPEGL